MDTRVYNRTEVENRISIRSIMTVHHHIMKNQLPNIDIHDFPEIVYIESGSAALIVDGMRCTVDAGQLMLYAPGASHGGAEPISATMNHIGFDADSDILPALYNRILRTNLRQQLLLRQIIDEGSRMFRRMAPGSEKNGMMLCDGVSASELQKLKNQLELLLLDLLHTCGGTGTAAHEPKTAASEFADVCSYIDTHLREHLTLERIAADSRMSVSKLKALFRAHNGRGAIAYITERRIALAGELLCTSSYSCTQIAELLGFGTVHYFSRVFRKATGMSPSEYRRLS